MLLSSLAQILSPDVCMRKLYKYWNLSAPPGCLDTHGGQHLLLLLLPCPSKPPHILHPVTQSAHNSWSDGSAGSCPAGACEKGKELIRAAKMTHPPLHHPTYLTPYARMIRPMRTPIVPSRYQTLGSCLNTSALMRMENPMTPPTRELNPGKHHNNLIFLLFLESWCWNSSLGHLRKVRLMCRFEGLCPLTLDFYSTSGSGTWKCRSFSKYSS